MIEAAASAGNLSAAEDWFRPQGQRASLFAFAQETVGRIDRAPGSTSFHLHTPFTSIHFHSLPFTSICAGPGHLHFFGFAGEVRDSAAQRLACLSVHCSSTAHRTKAIRSAAKVL
jgi:hypothetical protein